MKTKPHRLCAIGILLLVLILPAAVAAADSSSTSSTGSSTSSTSSTSTSSSTGSTSTTDAASLVYVSNVTMDPGELYPYEEGTITITLENGGSTAVGLTDPTIISSRVHIVNEDDWKTMTYIGAGSTISYSFRITADAPDGTDFALFTVGTKGGGSVHFPLVIRVSSEGIRACISVKPDSFTPSADEAVNLSIANPRDGEVKNLLITPSGDGIAVSPSEKYIGSLDAENTVDVPFTVTAGHAGNLTFHVSYEIGDSPHTTDVVLPITFGEDKTAAVPVLNNVALTSKGSYFDLTGDITNAGITDAKGLVVSVGSPAAGTGTYPQYAIGSLASDDSGSFELTFSAGDLSSVPVLLSWKDSAGDDYTEEKVLDLSSSAGNAPAGAGTGSTASGTGTTGTGGSASFSGAGGPPDMGGMGGPGGSGGPQGSGTSLFSVKGGGISSFYPLIAGGILCVAGIVLWKKRKWLSQKLKRQ
ncbi:MAG TPA: hypothetical protein VEI81_08540 [Methanoregula sp.]|nr:hypothetical protein [Methanoregula sp.]